MLKNLLKNPAYLDPDADDLQNLDSFFLVHRYVSGKVSTKIRSVVLAYVKLLTDGQTNRQTIKR